MGEKRVAQLVAEHRQERVLGAVRLLRLDAQLLEHLPGAHFLAHVESAHQHALDRPVAAFLGV
jgi:hypothetical protein